MQIKHFCVVKLNKNNVYEKCFISYLMYQDILSFILYFSTVLLSWLYFLYNL